jgi:putative membrane-bound dehydrogenase-like protein
MSRFAIAAALVSLVFAAPVLAQKCTSPDFKVELLYAAPEIEHPSVVTCDDDGNLFVGEDPMDMRGPTTKHFDRVQYIRWDKDGKPTKTVFCDNLAAVFGLVYRDGALYVMHAPLYSVFRDTDGDGVADERKDLASGFGPPAGVYGFNDHIVTGTRLGMDGKVYVSVGDKGIPKATGADGSTITLEGGGVVRMNLDGTELEVVTSGTRNHLDVAMDSLDNIFTYDNTDDGLGWWTRFTHHVPTGYYGYPYDYHPHPERHLPRMSEHGGGSPVGAACYREAAWPAKYRDAAFHCEWGKGKVQVFFLKKSGATFTNTMEDFLVKEGSEEFRPLDLCFSPDGKHMYLADWNFGGWVNPKVCGRLFRITYVGSDVAPEPPRAKNSDPLEAQIKSLGHPAHSERMRAQWNLAKRNPAVVSDHLTTAVLSDKEANKWAKIHAMWVLNALPKQSGQPGPDGLALGLKSNDAEVRAQAARILGMRNKSEVETQLLSVAIQDADPSVRMHAAISLGRIGEKGTSETLFKSLDDDDEFARFTKIQALRAIGDWKLAPKYLADEKASVREATLLALTEQYHVDAVSALAGVLNSQADPAFRAKALAALAEVHRKADPYKEGWWGTQPAKGKPARSKIHEWEGTPVVMKTLRESLQSKEPLVSQVAMKALSEMKDAESLPIVTAIALNKAAAAETRQDALKALLLTDAAKASSTAASMLDDASAPAPLVASALESLIALKANGAAASIEKRLSSDDVAVRAKAIETLARVAGNASAAAVSKAIAGDTSSEVRRAAIRAAGDVGLRSVLPALLDAASIGDYQQDAVLALAAMPDRRALSVYLQGLASKNQQVRDAARLACIAIKAEIGPEIIALHKANELTPEMRRELQAVFTAPAPIREWQIIGGWSKEEDGPPKLDFAAAPKLDQPIELKKRTVRWQRVVTPDKDGRVNLDSRLEPKGDVWAVAYAAVESASDQEATWVLGSDDQAILYVNGERLLATEGNRGWGADQNHGPVKLRKGTNHVYFVCGNSGGGWEMSLALRLQTPEYAFLFENVPMQLDLAAFREFALKNKGDDLRGLALFNDLKGVACVKCHAVKGQGGKIGPDLLGVGAKYPREELIRSVLEPSARVAESFQVQTIVTDEGTILTGVVKSENEKDVELVDANGKSTVVPKDAIEERTRSTVSLMPNGLKDGMSLQDFADIVAFLESLKQTQ